ncbi:MAG: exonuclease domain-containing protein, partial [Ruminococcus sp.]
MKTFGEFFNQYIDSQKFNTTIYNAEISDVNVNSKLRTISLRLELDALVSREDLHNAEKLIKFSVLSLNKVTIFPHFGKELFSEEYFDQLIIELKNSIPRINGTFKNSSVKVQGDTLCITLSNGGKAILDGVKFDLALNNLIKSEFDCVFKIVYDGVTEILADSQDYIDIQRNTEKQIERENLEKISELFEEEEKSIKESAKERADNAQKEIEIRSGEFLYPQIIKSSIRPYFGRMIKGKIISLNTVEYDSGRVTVWGDIFDIEKKVTKSGDKNIFTIDITDYTSSITVKVFGPIKETAIIDNLSKGQSIVVSGDVEFDKYAGEIVVNARSIGTAEKVKVVDNAPKKRVELHLHTNMSQMDGITPAKDLINRAAQWGHTAIAITDHGVAQAFPEAMNTASKINKDEEKIKVIYGTEAYFIDDLVESVVGESDESLDGTFICFDIETTGLSAKTEKITEIGAVKVVNGEIVDTFSTFVNPEKPIPARITELTGINDSMVKDAPSQSEAVSAFLEFAGDNVLVAHNAPFDIGFIRIACDNMSRPFTNVSIDTVAIARAILPDIKNCKLDTVAKYLR